jgi:hypothetical protein
MRRPALVQQQIVERVVHVPVERERVVHVPVERVVHVQVSLVHPALLDLKTCLTSLLHERKMWCISWCGYVCVVRL